jgi:uncharacterized membrane protein YbhN (UPF0104 family)
MSDHPKVPPENEASMDKGGVETIAARADSSDRRRRHRRRHKNHQSVNKPKGRSMEIFIVTLLALAILFGLLYFLLSRAGRGGEESRLTPAGCSSPGGAWPCAAAVSSSFST